MKYLTEELTRKLKEKSYPLERVYVQNGKPLIYDLPYSDPKWSDCKAWFIPQIGDVIEYLIDKQKILITVYSKSFESWQYRITKPGQNLEDGLFGEDFASWDDAALNAIERVYTELI
jgi:hypothetical protein